MPEHVGGRTVRPARGARVRLTLATEGRSLVGSFLALDGETLTLLVPPAERWSELPLGRIGVSAAPVPGEGAALAVSFRF